MRRAEHAACPFRHHAVWVPAFAGMTPGTWRQPRAKQTAAAVGSIRGTASVRDHVHCNATAMLRCSLHAGPRGDADLAAVAGEIELKPHRHLRLDLAEPIERDFD